MTDDNEELDALQAELKHWFEHGMGHPLRSGSALLRADETITALRARVAELQQMDRITMAGFDKMEGMFKVQVLRAELAESQLQQVKADAERYRWLRGPDSHTEYHAAWTLGWRITDGNNPYHGKRCDTGIDAARRNDGTA